MITTQQNLQNHLKMALRRKSTMAPHGMEGSYYSVFVETDLTIQMDKTEDAIAEYIASMLLLKLIRYSIPSYDGTYTTGVAQTIFRCDK